MLDKGAATPPTPLPDHHRDQPQIVTKGPAMQLDATSSALITGGGSGLGEATARRLAAQGVGVVLVDLEGSPAAEVAASLEDGVGG